MPEEDARAGLPVDEPEFAARHPRWGLPTVRLVRDDMAGAPTRLGNLREALMVDPGLELPGES
jgi:hypothetical protein